MKLKKIKKKRISDTINKITPNRKPCCTIPVWCPSNVDSRTTSRHQRNITQSKLRTPSKRIKLPSLKTWKYKTPPIVQINADRDAVKGQGLGSTKWKGWRW